ncbi:hypothetical protein ACFOOM_01990 [Streptomyces echinoruber]|uniref:Uncharacterized protein n=1 Tax=Streptomyces echinoruber TaxID=68898 RepID=A0A918QV20_9ACTN|nr:hypothetical protein [Streptomyces echinoruber]GGZ71840.1 hypothetical protein GCM10010389_06300 [Streptomyces echinoruber]
MELDQSTPAKQPSQGCLVVAVRLPVRIAVFVLVLPVRVAWDAAVAAGRFGHDTVLRPAGRALRRLGRALVVQPLVGLWRCAVLPAGRLPARLGRGLARLGQGLARLGHVLVVVPAGWLYRWALTPVGHVLAWAGRGIAWVGRGLGAVLAAVGLGLYAAGAWLGRYLVDVPARRLYAWVLAPVGRAVAWCAKGLVRLVGLVAAGVGFVLYGTLRVLVVLPLLVLWRWVLAPAGRLLAVAAREAGEGLAHAWRVAGRVSRAVGRLLATLARWLLVAPLKWVYLHVLTPVGHVVRDAVRDMVLRPAAEAVRATGRIARQALAAARGTLRQTRADLRRALLGEPRAPERAPRREPTATGARTLERSTTALTKD